MINLLFNNQKSSKSIIETLEKDTLGFSLLNPQDFSLGRARLTGFCNESDWLIFLERVGFDTEMSSCNNEVICIGNNGKISTKAVFKEVISGIPESEIGEMIINPRNFSIFLRGRKINLSLSEKDYEEAGIDLAKTYADPTIDNATKTIRYLCYVKPELIFLSDNELLEIAKINKKLEKIVQTYDWYHPDYRKEEQISNSISFTSLAKALEKCDKSLYQNEDKKSNSNWKYWPEWPN